MTGVQTCALPICVDDRDPRVTWHVGQERQKTYGVRLALRPWAPGAHVGARVSITGEVTAAEVSLDPETLATLGHALTQLARGGPAVTARVHALSLTFHRTETR